ncbi:hypothetical protein CEXT_360131 [Caerostris extrusa]|uniref:Uncharacterized protein n=1 Tax=Caerostris extrusa TaxID=172846 RepID=A0AAV4RC39_CAEEX|nr:hypothetical protein CEXT_360131 [Caerostris extrusa]
MVRTAPPSGRDVIGNRTAHDMGRCAPSGGDMEGHGARRRHHTVHTWFRFDPEGFYVIVSDTGQSFVVPFYQNTHISRGVVIVTKK